MHDGRNAWAPVDVEVTARARSRAARRSSRADRAASRPVSAAADRDRPPARSPSTTSSATRPAGVAAFETAYDQALDPVNNEMRLHTWGEEECCLAPGTTEAYLYRPAAPARRRPCARRWRTATTSCSRRSSGRARAPGGRRPDAPPARPDRRHPRRDRSAVLGPGHRRLPAIAQRRHPAAAPARALAPRRRARVPALPLGPARDGTLVRNVSVARGNVVLADHGLTTGETQTPDELTVDGRLELTHGPLTMECRPDVPTLDGNGASPSTGASSTATSAPRCRR